MDVDDILLDAEERMEKALGVYSDGLRGIRTGIANPGLVESIRIEYYGSQTPLKHIANIAIPDPRLIVIRPYDPSVLGDIEKAIHKSDIGINPQSDGRVIRLTVPDLSEERRKQLVSRVKDMAEEARVAIRNIRRDANKHLDAQEKESQIGEDDCKRGKKEVQDFTDEYEKQVDELLQKKTQEVMKV